MYRYIIVLTQFYISNSNITMIFGSVPTKFRFGSCGSFSFTGSMTPRFVPVRVCRFVSVRGHTVYIFKYMYMSVLYHNTWRSFVMFTCRNDLHIQIVFL